MYVAFFCGQLNVPRKHFVRNFGQTIERGVSSFSHCSGSRNHSRRLEAISLQPLLLQPSDLEWLLSISPCGSDPATGVDEDSLCGLIEAICNVNNPAHFEAIYSVAKNWRALHKRYQEILDGVPLVSPSADRQREYYRLTQELESTNPPPIDPPPAERIRMGLERFENGEISAWWPLTLNLILSPESPYYNELNLRITRMPGWTGADDIT
jgi:hypothetical protein